MTFTVAQALNEYIRATAKPRKPDGMWHPSGLYGCDRKTIYEVRGTAPTDDRDDRSYRILEVGQIMHDFIQGALKNSNTYVAQAWDEVKVSAPDIKLVGSVDMLVQHHDKSYEVLEFKTINSYAFKYKELPKEEHVGQVRAYLHALRYYGGIVNEGTPQEHAIEPLGSDLTTARIIYVSKDDMMMEEYPVEWTAEGDADLISRINRLESHQSAGTLPERLKPEVKKGKLQRNWLCGYCQFQTKCWDEDKEA